MIMDAPRVRLRGSVITDRPRSSPMSTVRKQRSSLIHNEQLLVFKVLCSLLLLFGFYLMSNFNAKTGTSPRIAVDDHQLARQEGKGQVDVRARTLTVGRLVARTV